MNQKRFEAIYRLYYEELLSFAKNHVSDPYLAEDMVQETFLFFFEHGMNNASCKNNLLYSTLISILKDTCKYSISELSSDDVTFTNSENSQYISSLFQTFIQQQLVQKNFEKIEPLILQLPTDEQQLLMLYYFEKKNAKEISNQVSISHGTVRKKLDRSKKKLREMYLKIA